MKQYIPKSALVAEIESRLDELYDLLPNASKVENGSITTSEACNTGKYTALESFRRFINTLEVKEVDLEKEINRELETRWRGEYLYTKKFRESAKHFFELGLKAKNRDNEKNI